MTIEAVQTLEGEQLKKRASSLHSVIIMRLGRRLAAYVEDHNLGHVLESSATYNFQDGLPKRQPDLSFIPLDKMPMPLDDELTIAPDLAVEVVSKSDTDYEIEKKIQQYQQAGVKMVWVIHLVSQTVGIYRLATGLLPQTIGIAAELDSENVIPGFKLPVSLLFR